MSAKGGPIFTFSLPGGAARPLPPTSVTPMFGADCFWEKIALDRIAVALRSSWNEYKR